MEIERARRMAADVLNYHLPSGYTFGFDRSKARFGCCEFKCLWKGDAHPYISMSLHLTRLNSEEKFLDTLLHEIAHALAGPRENHSDRWRCIAINLGCTGTRCYGSDVITPQHNYRGTCPACGRTVMRHRQRALACGKCCKGTFQAKFKFVWEKI